jgi:hypothetical protein
MASLEVGHLTFGLFARNSVAFLYSADELIALPFDNSPVVVSQFAPFLLGLADELLSVSLHLVGVHLGTSVHDVAHIVGTAQKV